MKNSTQTILKELLNRYPELYETENSITKAFEQLHETFTQGGKVLICGNGGSAADSDHIVGELVKGFKLKRELPGHIKEKFNPEDKGLIEKLQMGLPAINLSAQSALVSAISNDTGADMIFAQQVFSYGQKEDCVLGISTSGCSQNIVIACKVAKSMGLKTIGMTGKQDCQLDEICDIVVKTPSCITCEIQEFHLPIYHTICAMLEEEFFGLGEIDR